MARHAQSLFLFPIATLVPALLATEDTGGCGAEFPAESRPVLGELVIDLDTFTLLDGPPSLELVDACSRAPFGAAAAARDLHGTWQYVSPRLRAAERRTSDVRVVYLDATAETGGDR